MAKIFGNPFLRFVVLGSGLYLGWYVAYEFWLKGHSKLDSWVIGNLISATDYTLSILGFDLWNTVNESTGAYVGIADGFPLEVGAPCDGLVLWALFLSFMIAFPGPIKHKLWFIPLGLGVIHLINIVRIVSLAIIIHYKPSALDFNHDYTFTILVYSIVFLLWYIWVARFASLKDQGDA